MPKLAANISWLFTEVAFLARPAAAAQCGFGGVECLFPYAEGPDDLASALSEAQIELVMFNLPPGDWSAGDRGLAAVPGREREFAQSLEVARRYADRCGARRLHAMAGIGRSAMDPARSWNCYLSNLRMAAKALADDGITLLIEPINRGDMPGYVLGTLEDAVRVQDAVGEPNISIQADLYHLQIEGGDLVRRIEKALPRIGHVQVAGVPHRHEPDGGELRHEELFALLDTCGYTGWIGCEYRPRGATREGLYWAGAWL
jgi:hydroxypyruvate isomerase